MMKKTLLLCRFLSASKRQHLRFYRSFFSLFPKFHFSQKIPFCHFYPQISVSTCTSTDCFFSLIHFSQNFTFPKKIPFCHFYPQTTIPPSLLQIVFCTFSLFPKKNPFCQFVISTHKQQYPQHFYRSFFALLHFSPQKIPFCQFYPSFYRSFFPLFSFSQKWYTFYWFENFHELRAKNLSFHIRHESKQSDTVFNEHWISEEPSKPCIPILKELCR